MTPGPAFSSFPLAKEDVALVVADEVPGRRRSRRRCARARASCSSRCGSSTSTPGEQIGDGQKSLAFALRFRAPDRTLTEAETGAARDAAVARAAEVVGAVQR